MKKVVVYSKENCPYCVRAKRLLKENDIPFEEIDMSDRLDEAPALKDKLGMQTFPMIVVDGKVLGGFNELQELEDSGGLFKLLA